MEQSEFFKSVISSRPAIQEKLFFNLPYKCMSTLLSICHHYKAKNSLV